MYCSSSGVSGSDFACLARYSPSISSMVSACHSSLVTGTSEMWHVKGEKLLKKEERDKLKVADKVPCSVFIQHFLHFVTDRQTKDDMWQDERWVTPPGQTSSTGSFSWPARGSSRSWRSQTCQRSWEGSVSAGETLGNLDNWGEGENRTSAEIATSYIPALSFAESWIKVLKSGAEIEQIEDRCHFGHFSAGLSSPDTIRRTIREGGHLKHYLCWWSCICSTIQPHWGESLYEEQEKNLNLVNSQNSQKETLHSVWSTPYWQANLLAFSGNANVG